MRRAPFINGLLCALLVGACGGDRAPESSQTTSGAQDTGTGHGHEATGVPTSGGDDPTTSGTSTTTDPTAATGIGSGDTTTGTTDGFDTCPCNFTCEKGCETDTETEPVACSTNLQDCPEGEKCTPYAANGADYWNATKCVPITGEGAPGDACIVEGGGSSGVDDCRKGAFCWDIDENPDICVELAGGSEAAPTCTNEADFDAVCVGEVFCLCLPRCDPLVQDCQGDDLCIPINDTFVCVLDASGADTGKALDPCEFANACDKGLLCLQPSASSKCDANAGGCCMPFCDLADQAAADAGCKAIADDTSCVSLYEEGMAPPDFENVGICVLPG